MRPRALAAVAVVFAGAALFGPGTPTAAADCAAGFAVGSGGSQCDGPFYPDGSFQRCVSVYVLGIGGSNCFIVPPPPRS